MTGKITNHQLQPKFTCKIQRCPKCDSAIEYPDSPPTSRGFCPHCGFQIKQGLEQELKHEVDFGIRITSGKTDQKVIRHRG